MNENVIRLLAAYFRLSYQEQQEIKQIISRYDYSNNIEKGILSESLRRQSLVLGPMDKGTCPYCGK